jgi:hypothetical protein
VGQHGGEFQRDGECAYGRRPTELLADKRELGLFPVVIVIDECQVAFDGDPDTVAMVTDLGKRGPAAGIIVLLATQRVDAQSLPTGISSNAVLRWCLKVTGQVENDMNANTAHVVTASPARSPTSRRIGSACS